jgi:ribonuclease-3
VVADALEAVIGAIFLDGGYRAAHAAVVRAFRPLLDAVDPGHVEKDAKTRLQELMHARGRPLPEYRVVATHGAPHERSFEVDCVIEGRSTRGSGTSRQRAEQDAARAMLEQLER